MITAIIIDVEISECEFLKTLIADNNIPLDIVGFAVNVNEALKLIEEKNPDIVFIDFSFIKDDLFAKYDETKKFHFDLIIISNKQNCSFQSHCVAEMNCILKPVNADDLAAALNRRKWVKHTDLLIIDNARLQKEYDEVADKNIPLTIKKGSELIRINSLDIMYGNADGNETTLYLINQTEPMTIDMGMGELLCKLPKEQFLKIHKSWFVRIKHIKKACDKGEYVIMVNDKSLVVANRERSTLLKLFNNR